MLRRTSTRVKEVVDKIRLPVATVRYETAHSVDRQVTHQNTRELPRCGMKGLCSETCRSAGAVPGAGAPQSQLQCGLTCENLVLLVPRWTHILIFNLS
jgi:hypothetical protein